MVERKSLSVKRETWLRMYDAKHPEDTWDDLMDRLLDTYEEDGDAELSVSA